MTNDFASITQTMRRRRTRYIDAPLQRWLWLVVVLEVIVAAASVGLLYCRLNGLIEANLYRVHFSSVPSIMSVLMHDGFMLILLFIAGNIIALLVATFIWAYYVHGIVLEFTALVEKTHRLDFSADKSTQARHEVLSRAMQWRVMERERLAAIRQAVASLDAGQPDSANADALNRLRRLLP